MKQPPLWMPEGSLRGILGIGIVMSTVSLAFIIGLGSGEVPKEMWTLAGFAAGYYFARRDAENAKG